jgi:hypothetical protein
MNESRIPNEEIASNVVEAMTNEKILSSIRMTTGDQYFVFAIKTANSDYVIRMKDGNHKNKFNSAIYWQDHLLTLGIPLAKLAAIFDANQISKVISIAKDMEEDLRAIRSIPFLLDASERNVIVYNGMLAVKR